MAVLTPIVLVPGACLGAWAWDEVAGRLRSLGHDVHPVTLSSADDADLETHIAQITTVLDGVDDAVLVGHSYGGVPVAGAADRRPERLRAVIYLDTGPLADGMAVVDVQTPEQAETTRRDVTERGEGVRWPLPDRERLATGAFGSTAGMTDEHFALLEQRGTPQPYGTFTTPLRLEHARPPGVRRVAIVCTAGGLDLTTLRALIAQGHPLASAFADDDWELHELPTGHWPMFSMPDRLADLLHEIAEGPDGPVG